MFDDSVFQIVNTSGEVYGNQTYTKSGRWHKKHGRFFTARATAEVLAGMSSQQRVHCTVVQYKFEEHDKLMVDAFLEMTRSKKK